MTRAHEDPDTGVAGRSAQREYQRKREQRLQRAQGRSTLARFIAAVAGPSTEEKRHRADERHWATGAAGEELLARTLARRCPGARVLHDRRMPNSRANIDHIAITASGVHVIDTKRYRGKIKVVTPIFGPPKLVINGRDRTRLLQGLGKQVAAVRAATTHIAGDVSVEGCLCFVTPEGLLADVGLPMWRTLKVDGYALHHPRSLARRLNRHGPLTPEQTAGLERELARRLPAA